MLFVLGLITGLLISILMLLILLYFKPEVTQKLKKIEQVTKQKGAVLSDKSNKERVKRMFGL